MYSAISDTQETIRFTDTKSGAIIVLSTAFVTAFVAILEKYNCMISYFSGTSKFILNTGLIIFGICIVISMFLSLKSLHPNNDPNEHLKLGTLKEKPSLSYYITQLSPKFRWRDYLWEMKSLKVEISISDYLNNINHSDVQEIIKSLTYEFLKLSYIKEKKIRRTQAGIKLFVWGSLILVISLVLFYILK